MIIRILPCVTLKGNGQTDSAREWGASLNSRGSAALCSVMFAIRLSGDARMPNPLLRGPNAEQFIATGCSHRIKNRLAAAAANHFPARCQPKKHGVFPAWAMRTPQFAHPSLPIVLRLSISHTNVSHFFGTFLRNDYFIHISS